MMMATKTPALRGVVTAIVMLNIPLIPAYANMIAVAFAPYAWARTHNFELALVVLLIVTEAIRRKLRAGIIVNIVIALSALVTLFWSEEPLAYLGFIAGLGAAVLLLYGSIYFLTRTSKNGGGERTE
jgi:hypothetical protein